MWDCFSLAPYWGPGPQPRHVPWLGIELVTLWFTGWCSIHWATPARAKCLYFIIPKWGLCTFMGFTTRIHQALTVKSRQWSARGSNRVGGGRRLTIEEHGTAFSIIEDYSPKDGTLFELYPTWRKVSSSHSRNVKSPALISIANASRAQPIGRLTWSFTLWSIYLSSYYPIYHIQLSMKNYKAW